MCGSVTLILISLLAVSVIIGNTVRAQEIPENGLTHEACHGSYSHDAVFVDPKCPSNTTALAIKAVKAGAKKRTIENGCPILSSTSGVSDFATYEQLCCKQSPTTGDDCITTYLNVDPYYTFKYQRECSGQHWPDCYSLRLRAATMNTPCDTTIYNPQTNFMIIEYICIEQNNIGNICSSVTRTTTSAHPVLYLQSNGYPSAVTPPSSSASCTCSITTNCPSVIKIVAMDTRLQQDSEAICRQTLTVTDGDYGSTTFDCSINNNFEFKKIFASQTSRITIKFNNFLSVTGGYFWLGFVATPNASLTLSCEPDTATSTCCSGACTTPDPDWETGGTTTSLPGQSQASTGDQGLGSGEIAAVVLGMFLLILLILLSMCLLYFFCWKKKHKEENKIIPQRAPQSHVMSNGVNPALRKTPSRRNTDLAPLDTQFNQSQHGKKKKRPILQKLSESTNSQRSPYSDIY